MPIRPDELRAGLPNIVSEDRACVGCGYNLVGLRTDGQCPECGRPVSGRKRVPRYSDNLVNAPLAWLGPLALGGFLVFASAAAILVLALVWIVSGRVEAGLAVAAAAAAWFVGTLLVTRPRPVMPATVTDPRAEWSRLRLIARLTQGCLPLAFALVLVHVQWAGGAVGGVHLGLLGALLLLVAVAGLGPWCVYASNLAFWAADSALAGHLRTCAWVISAAGFVTVLGVFNEMTGLLGRVVAALVYVILLFIYVPFLYMLFCLRGLMHMTRWAVANHSTAEARDERLREKARLAAAAAGTPGGAAAPPPVVAGPAPVRPGAKARARPPRPGTDDPDTYTLAP